MDTNTTEAPHSHTNRCWWNPDEARWVCRGDAGSERPLVDVRDMVVVHTAMLRELRLAPAAVARTRPHDCRRARTVGGHLRFVCDLLHHHHAGEDELLWPKLRERTPRSALAEIEHAEQQHEAIDAGLEEVGQLLAAWQADPSAEVRDRLATALERLHALLAEHLELEERALLPLAASALTFEEWAAIGAAGAASVPKSALMLVFGMFAYEGDPEVLAAMLGAAPRPARVLVPRIAPRVYARRARAVHGTSRP